MVLAKFHQVVAWFLSLGPIGLAIEFLAVVVVVFAALWWTCKNRSAVFWKRTDYAYFLLTILGGAAGAADLAISNCEQNQITLLSNLIDLRGYVSYAVVRCNQPKPRRSSPEIIIPKDTDISGADVDKYVKGTEAYARPLTDEECGVARTIASDLESNSLRNPAEYELQELDFMSLIKGLNLKTEYQFEVY